MGALASKKNHKTCAYTSICTSAYMRGNRVSKYVKLTGVFDFIDKLPTVMDINSSIYK